jgi:hypothetical protein
MQMFDMESGSHCGTIAPFDRRSNGTPRSQSDTTGITRPLGMAVRPDGLRQNLVAAQ